jgi:hypothetical protein
MKQKRTIDPVTRILGDKYSGNYSEDKIYVGKIKHSSGNIHKVVYSKKEDKYYDNDSNYIIPNSVGKTARK